MGIRRSLREQVIGGIRLSGLVLLTFVTAVLLVWGALVVTSQFKGPIAAGSAALVAGFLILVLNLRGWAKMLPGLLGLAAFNAVIMAISGHVLNDPATSVSRGMAIGTAVALAIGSLLSTRFYAKRLSPLDRVVLVAYVGLILSGFVTQRVVVSFSLGTLALAVPWVTDRIERGSHPTA